VGREVEEGGAGKGEKARGGKEGKYRKCKEAKVKLDGFVDGSREWGREGSGDCGRVALEKSGVSKSRRPGAKRRGGLLHWKSVSGRILRKKRTILAEAITKITMSRLLLQYVHSALMKGLLLSREDSLLARCLDRRY